MTLTYSKPRERPPPGVARNDINGYNALLDGRAYSPNGRGSGFAHWDPEEIRLETVFTPMHFESPPNEIPHRAPSPLPEEGSLEFIFAGSLGHSLPDIPCYDCEPFVVLDHYAPRRATVTDASLLPSEVHGVVRRLRALAVTYQQLAIGLRYVDGQSWDEAFHFAEEEQRLVDCYQCRKGFSTRWWRIAVMQG